MSVHQVSLIDVKDFGPGALRIGDLNGDGAPDLLLVQSIYETREITCLTAITIRGEVIWQKGTPSASNTRLYSDLPVQVYDWDNDGANEVLYVRQAKYVGARPGIRERADRYEGDATMVVLDARNGQEKKTFPLPAPADDSFLFADLTGRGRRQDLVAKDRYWNLWGVSFEGKVLWHWKGSTGHFPAVADLDDDGKDEVYVGYTLIDHDGKVLFDRHPAGGNPNPHSDANWILRLPDGSWRLAFGNTGVHLLTPDGKELWRANLPEAQHVVAGPFRGDSPAQLAAVERGERTPAGVGTLHLFDLDGKRLWKKVLPPGSWAIAIEEIDWSGAGQPREILAYGFRSVREYAAVYDGAGNVVDTLAVPFKAPGVKVSGKEACYSLRANVWGDSRHEVILYGAAGICIYANARPLAEPTLYNETLYTGM
ncbi:MAG TPA: hypothetical protein VNE39_02415 [Planctomycetota bacterium]|nr:hypothetical protein [Planctomycetota bacterium]